MKIMRLPCDLGVIGQLSLAELIVAIWVRRQAIRYHRDQKGDDRCWLDDWLVWQFLRDTPPIPAWSTWKARCEEFYEHRNSNDPDTLPGNAILDPDKWDSDLWHYRTDADQLRKELMHVQEAIQVHRDIVGRSRHFDDDKVLYMVLPENLTADFNLPSRGEFLGDALAPNAGCPAFRRSHEYCDPRLCNPHRWGSS